MTVRLICAALVALAGCGVKTESGTLENHQRQRVTVMCPGLTFSGWRSNINGAIRITTEAGQVLDDGWNRCALLVEGGSTR